MRLAGRTAAIWAASLQNCAAAVGHRRLAKKPQLQRRAQRLLDTGDRPGTLAAGIEFTYVCAGLDEVGLHMRRRPCTSAASSAMTWRGGVTLRGDRGKRKLHLNIAINVPRRRQHLT